MKGSRVATIDGSDNCSSGELPPWVNTALLQWPVSQAVLGGLVGISMLRPTPKQGQLWLMAVARGAVQGSASLDSGSGTEKDEFTSISELGRVLLLVQKSNGRARSSEGHFSHTVVAWQRSKQGSQYSG